jgi:hypothetical protein
MDEDEALEPLDEDEEKQLDVAAYAFDAEVSWSARQLIATILNAMVNDPHPAWDSFDRDRVYELKLELENDLPSLMQRIIDDELVTGEVTTFDVLHWLTRHLESICPVTK